MKTLILLSLILVKFFADNSLFVDGEMYHYPKTAERVYIALVTKDDKAASIKVPHVDIQEELMNAILMLKGKSDKKGLAKIKLLIKQDPKKFKDSYCKLFLNPNRSKQTDILKKGYIRFIDLILFKELAKSGVIDSYMQDLAIDYIFFSSYKNFANKHLPFMELFRDLVQNNPKNNNKENQELVAIFEANYLLNRGRNRYAYRILQENTPYGEKTLKTLGYFSSIKNIPIFRDREKIQKIIGMRLRAPQFEHKPEFLFDFKGKKYDMKDFQW